ncbi:MAG: prepilin peptidase, partial [Thermohalobaculum sp.]|nr:prepilin peptidase [Thermohalobaculum sp.]
MGVAAPLTLIAAPVVGSFMALVADRWGTGEGMVAGRSRCDACRTPLGARDLVPLASWLALGGRCRHCDARIGGFAPLMELAALAVAVWSVLVFPAALILPSAVLGWVLLTAAEIDRRHMILPDALTLGLIPLGLGTIWLVAPAALGDAVLGVLAGGLSLGAVRAAYAALRG